MIRLRTLGVAVLLGLLGLVGPHPASAQIIISPPPVSAVLILNPNLICLDNANQDVCLTRGGPGILTISAVGLANNLDLDIDLETSATQIGFSSPAGATGITLTGLDLTMELGTQRILFPNLSGSASLPSIAWADAGGVYDTGIFQPATNQIGITVAATQRYTFTATTLSIKQGNSLSFDTAGGGGDLFLTIDAANIAAWRNGANAQENRIYNTFTSDVENEFLSIGWIDNLNVLSFETKANGTGTVRDMAFLGGNIGFGTVDPLTLFHIAGAVPTAYIEATGAADATLILEDTDEAGCTEITALNGVLTVATVACPA